MIERRAEAEVERALGRFPVVAVLGPRQVGKTTLARSIASRFERDVDHLDLELPSHVARLADPELYLERHREDLVVLDEVQRMPDLFPVLRALVDDHRVPGRFLLLGSASPDLVRSSSESLAGRIAFVELDPLTIDEVGRTRENLERLWLRGGFPEAYLAEDDDASLAWREAFVRTWLERDVPALGLALPTDLLRRFWRMLAHRHGQAWNASELARGLGVSAPTVGRYLDVLLGTFVARRLEPYHANLGKRLVRSPKVYLRDSGLLHAILDIGSTDDLLGHPVAGASWEGFVCEQVLGVHRPRDACFYRSSGGAELDLLVRSKGRTWTAYEAKLTTAPKPGRGFWNAVADVGAEHAYVVTPGDEGWPLRKPAEVLPALRIGMEDAPHAGDGAPAS